LGPHPPAAPSPGVSCGEGGEAGDAPAPTSAGDEVLGLGVMADQRRGGLLGLVLEAGLLAALQADALAAEQAEHGHVVLEVGAGGVAPRVAAAPVLLAEQAGQRRAVLAGEAPLLADPT